MDRPNRPHPTLAPLTSLPTSPHASPSYIYPTTSIPSTPSLLSRPSSQTRLRPARSTPTAVPTTISSPSQQNAPHQKKKRPICYTNDAEDDWVTRTASTLTLTRLEEKGQSWLAARNSSTSLIIGEGEDNDDDDEPYPSVQSARGSGARLEGLSRMHSRAQSRIQSRAQSRRGSIGRGEGELVREVEGREQEEKEIRPDFVNVEDEVVEEGEKVDEGEMRRVVMGRVGGWVDWAVGWINFSGEGEEEDDSNEAYGVAGKEGGEAYVRGELDPVELQKRLRRKKKRDEDEETGGEGASAVGSAPETAGVWSDAKWLFRVAAKAAS